MNRDRTSRRRFLLLSSSLLGTGLFGAAACGATSAAKTATTETARDAGTESSPKQAPRKTATESDASTTIDKVTYKVDTDDPVVFLTIDDGVTRDPDMADILEENDLKATLFLTDQYVRQDPDFFRGLRDRTGSRIENHTLDHPDLSTKSFDEQLRQIGETSDHYQQVFGHRPTLMRPPYGNFNDDTLRAAQESGVKHVVHWTAVIDQGAIQFAADDHLTSGDIVLMHFTEHFREDVERFVAEAQQSGLEPALLEGYLN
ncbi:polysaccharide deacetylase family protein [Glycomyces buryatensis]|uniref:Polysaccharide deacetylase family protein n=1 Tax=Glycomyces buryatensis TaxID=2570927 RepID=A0A4S8Q3J1_9ACTN|nr:polysaccharide deacetylase family protein [Glycomyces buryatensis]THV37095.1 polysaccharide deacetylase family protein [Glycomyces buryatensis]